MKKILIIITIALCGCAGTEEKQISKSDSLSAAIDSARAADTLLIKLQTDTLTFKQKTK